MPRLRQATTDTTATYKVIVRSDLDNHTTLLETEDLGKANALFDSVSSASPRKTVILQDETTRVYRIIYAND